MPAEAGIQKYQVVTNALDPGFRRGDDFYDQILVFKRMENNKNL